MFYVEGLESVEEGRNAVQGAFIMYCVTFGLSLAYVSTVKEEEEENEITMVEIQRPRSYDLM